MSGGYIWNPNTGQFDSVDNETKASDVQSTVSAYDYFNGFLPQQDLPAPQKTSGACVHEWKEYHGLRESYRFCILCDYKKEL